MKNEAPYYFHKVECPVCSAVNEFETLKVGAYVEQGRDTDFMPIGVEWRNPKYQRFNPTLFFVATCANCFYSREYTSKFREWKKDANFKNYRLKQIKAKHTEHLAQDDSVLKLLGGCLDSNEYPQPTAVNKLLLAIYDELLTDHPAHLDVARFYIRIAWLFREGHTGNNTDEGTYLRFISKFSEDVQSLMDAHSKLDDVVRDTQGTIGNQLAEPAFSQVQDAERLRSQFEKTAALLSAALHNVDGAVSFAKETLRTINDLSIELSGDDVFTHRFGNYQSYRAYLKMLRAKWAEVPLNEYDALKLSLKYYKLSYEAGREVSNVNQKIQVEYLMGELNRRLRTHDDAKKYFNAAIKSAQAYIYEMRGDKSATALARKILDMAMTQGKINLGAMTASEAK